MATQVNPSIHSRDGEQAAPGADWLDELVEEIGAAAAEQASVAGQVGGFGSFGIEQSVDLGSLTDTFVQAYDGMKQRDQRWYESMGVTVGGSELAAIMGLNPYSSFYDVVNAKITTLDGGSSWDGGGEACWWGVLFEDVIGAYAEIDLGAPLKGDEICIQVIAGHRNSPDGYITGRFYKGSDGRLHLWTTDMSPAIPTISMILLVEFKCPLTRKPKGDVPAYYRPQVWSGLAVSPIAHKGLFVDAVFRKCGLLDLGDTPDYDTEYHNRDKGAWERPVAWGLVGVYAPRLDAPRHVRLGWRGAEWSEGDPLSEEADADAAQAAWQIHSAYFGLRLKNQGQTRDVADLGDMEWRLFNRALGLINRRRFRVVRVAPCFADGRGQALHTGREIGDTVEVLRLTAPDHHWLMGVLPWKLFEVDYVPVDRRPGFLDEVLPLIEDVHQTVVEARASGNPAAYLNAKAAKAVSREAPPPGRSAVVGDAEIQDLFDSISSAPPGDESTQ